MILLILPILVSAQDKLKSSSENLQSEHAQDVDKTTTPKHLKKDLKSKKPFIQKQKNTRTSSKEEGENKTPRGPFDTSRRTSEGYEVDPD